MKLAFSICSLTCPPWSFHTFLCLTLLLQSSYPPPLPHLSLPLSLFLPSTSLQTSSPINLSWTFARNAHSQAGKYGADSFISYTKRINRNMRAIYYKYAFCTWDTFQETGARECIKRLTAELVQEIKNEEENRRDPGRHTSDTHVARLL